MGSYKFKGRDKTGASVYGFVDTGNLEDWVEQLYKEGWQGLAVFYGKTLVVLIGTDPATGDRWRQPPSCLEQGLT